MYTYIYIYMLCISLYVYIHIYVLCLYIYIYMHVISYCNILWFNFNCYDYYTTLVLLCCRRAHARVASCHGVPYLIESNHIRRDPEGYSLFGVQTSCRQQPAPAHAPGREIN